MFTIRHRNPPSPPIKQKINQNKMTAKEKAEELVARYDVFQTFIENFHYHHAKECALIAVDECIKHEQKILTQIQSLNFPNSFIITLNDGVFCEEVKHEINNL